MSQILSLYRALFRRSANFYVSKLRFAVAKIQNLDTGHVYEQIQNLDCRTNPESWYWPRLPSRFGIWLGTTLIHMHDMTRSHVWHDSFICVTWLPHICDMTHSHVWHDSPTCVTWLTHMCDMTHSHVWHDSPTRVTRLTWIQVVHQLWDKDNRRINQPCSNSLK